MKPILEVRNLSKRYSITHLPGGYLSLREQIFHLFAPRSQRRETLWALKDISFDLKPGDSFGIIGRNGAGKSTLLKILARITPPTTGKVLSRGRIASLLEVGTGFHQELTGRENILFNGSLLGMKKKEILSKFDEIVDFSGTEQFLDTPIKHFSSGMQLRLAFSVAAFLEPEILVLDEVLAVGDINFQKKCFGKMEDVSRSGRTIILVSHDLNAISNLCKSVLVLKQGSPIFIGGVMQGITTYLERDNESTVYTQNKPVSGKPMAIRRIEVCDESGQAKAIFLYTDPIVLKFDIEIIDPGFRCDLFVMVLDSKKRRVFALETSKLQSKMKLIIEPVSLVRGSYSICAFINQPNVARIDEVYDVCSFDVNDNGSDMQKHGDYDYGSVFGRGKWVFQE